MTDDKDKIKRQTAARQARRRERLREVGKVQIYDWMTLEEKAILLDLLCKIRGGIKDQ